MTSGTTPNLGILKPAGGDYQQIGPLQDAFDVIDAALKNTPWVDCIVNSGFTVISTAEKPQVKFFNGVIYLRGGFNTTSMTLGAFFTPGALPTYLGNTTYFNPPTNVAWGYGASNGSAVGGALISSAGDIQIRTNGTNLGSYVKLDHSWLKS